MTELIFILLQFFIIYVVLSFNITVLNYKFVNPYSFSLIENICFNTLVLFNIILLISFFNVNLQTIINIYFTYLVILIIFYIYKYKTIFLFNKSQIFYLIFFFIISTTIFFEIANNLVIGWDAGKFWIYKTLNFYNGNTLTNLSNLPNSWYPYLGSLVWAFFWKISFLENEYSGRLFYVFFYVSSLMLLINNLKISNFSRMIFLMFFVLITYDYTIHSHFSMFAGNQEILIFSLIAMAMHYLFKLSNKDTNLQNFYIFLILLICNSLVWIKHEGLIISSILIFTLILFFKLNKKKKFYIFSAFLIILSLRYFIFDYYDLNSSEIHHVAYKDLSVEGIISRLTFERILIVLNYVLLNLLTNYLILVGIFFSFLILLNKKSLKKIYYVFFFGASNLIIFSLLYLVTDADLTYVLKTGIGRIIYQFSPFMILIFIEYFNSNKFIKI